MRKAINASIYDIFKKICCNNQSYFKKNIYTLKTLRYFDHNDLKDNYYHGHACHKSFFYLHLICCHKFCISILKPRVTLLIVFLPISYFHWLPSNHILTDYIQNNSFSNGLGLKYSNCKPVRPILQNTFLCKNLHKILKLLLV